ncbi:MAG: polysaccharide deacetylase [Bacteroides sp. SM23_62_1]|nr:MAG: polysaccharide deacetylase [Bacteroides sp. SM23_62_1]
MTDDPCLHFECEAGGIVRGDRSEKSLVLVFTGDEFADGGEHILSILKNQNILGSFFFTGNFYRNPGFEQLIRSLLSEDHYLGAHSDRHLLYCDWENRDNLLVTKEEFIHDLENNYKVMNQFGIRKDNALYFLPPYEWHNDSISTWTKSLGLQLINYTPGTLSHADYTTPDMPNYKSSEDIYKSIIDFEKGNDEGLNGFILLSHFGAARERTDKFYFQLESLITELKIRGYQFKRIDELLNLK